MNVHPAKLEVRFTDERPVYEAVYFSVKSSLAEFDAPRDVELPPARRVSTSPNMHEYSGVQIDLNQSVRSEAIRTLVQQASKNQAVNSQASRPSDRGELLTVSDPGLAVSPRNPGIVPPVPPTYEEAVRASEPEIHGTLPPDNSESFPVPDENSETPSEAEMPQAGTPVEETATVTDIADSFIMPEYRIVGEIFNTYILVESGGELILIDKHAAHERLIYERLLR